MCNAAINVAILLCLIYPLYSGELGNNTCGLLLKLLVNSKIFLNISWKMKVENRQMYCNGRPQNFTELIKGAIKQPYPMASMNKIMCFIWSCKANIDTVLHSMNKTCFIWAIELLFSANLSPLKYLYTMVWLQNSVILTIKLILLL